MTRPKIISCRTHNIPISLYVQSMIELARIKPEFQTPIGYLQTTRFTATVFETNTHIFPFIENEKVFNVADYRIVAKYVDSLTNKNNTGCKSLQSQKR